MSATPPDDEFRLGRRIAVIQNQTAQPTYQATPLTLADFLDPAPGDEFVHGEQHRRDVARLAAALYARHRLSPFVHLLVGPKLKWAAPRGHPRLPQPAPDLVLVGEISDPDHPRTVLDLAAEPTVVRAVVEVTSPLFAELDLKDKPRIYAAAGIPEYWIVDAGLRPAQPQLRYAIMGYRLDGDAYRPIAPDRERGNLTSPAMRVCFRVTPDGQDYLIADARTGRPIIAAAEDAPNFTARVEATFRAADIAAKLDLRP